MAERAQERTTGKAWEVRWLVAVYLICLGAGVLSIYATCREIAASFYFGGGSSGSITVGLVFEAEFVVISSVFLVRALRDREQARKYRRYLLNALGVFLLLGCGILFSWLWLSGSWLLD